VIVEQRPAALVREPRKPTQQAARSGGRGIENDEHARRGQGGAPKAVSSTKPDASLRKTYWTLPDFSWFRKKLSFQEFINCEPLILPNFS
jgi:hypothetical protein